MALEQSISVYRVVANADHQLVGSVLPGGRLQGLHEGSTYLVKIPVGGAKAFLDDEPLPQDEAGQYWQWSPGFYAGDVGLDILAPPLQRPASYVLAVSPHQQKVQETQFEQYLADIAEFAPYLLVGSEPAQRGMAGKSSELSIWIRYSRLRAFIECYLRSLREITEHPLTRMRYERRRMPLHQVRRLDYAAAVQLVRNPVLATALHNSGGHRVGAAASREMLSVPNSESTLDNAANRLIKSQMLTVLRLIEFLATELQRINDTSNDARTSIAARIPRRLGLLAVSRKVLLNYLRLDPFAQCGPDRGTVVGLNAIASHPLYGYCYRQGSKLLAQGISNLADDEQHYLVPSWEVYETWCFCAIARALEERFPNYQWDLRKQPKYADFVYEGVKDDGRIRLYFQLVCPSMDKANSHGYSSISRERRPDIVLEIIAPEERRYFCLDSKYMAGRSSIVEGMASAHIYHDSIRRDGGRPLRSLLLVPRISNVQALAESKYVDTYHVGCFELATGQDARQLLLALI